MSRIKKLSFAGTLVRVMGFSFIGALAAFAMVAVIMLVRPETEKMQVMTIAGLVASVLIMGAAMIYSIRWWRGVDEAVRQAHSWAWYWGGSTGLLFVGVFYIVSVFTDGEVSRRLVEMLGVAGREVELGVGIATVPMLIGYGIAWVIWWLRHR
ncbi:TMEM199/VMA12 family vacuolar ATPase assembly factor [Asticcacaulis sp. AND118]|uniref:TMEM199/VMA12 family vacuolar ATPase assembly factor n=1 Tax=Asticcacaulis sp. AND118 TaxID=2840468 RepID=UPI001CFF5DE3|nr:TMEM199/VMA12 family vacuolar ATPase assembly factor [Asticcacaulis sp. AND118]UDF03876.1 TMEM199/VMA12 family vacuolar ATPase assembly factor [Asticcacaulis sp. AND118]